jgi:hypothetical protein
MRVAGIGPGAAARAVGALDAAALGALAAWLARTLARGGAAAFVLAGAAFWTGALALMTGYDKALSELCVAVLIVGGASLRLARSGRGGAALAAGLAAGLLLHRVALLLVPVAAAGAIAALRVPRERKLPSAATWCAMALLVAAAALVLPRLSWLAAFDTQVNFLPAETRVRGGALAAAFAGTRVLDLVNLLLAVAPLSLLVVPLALVARPAAREAWVIAALLAPLVGFLPFFHSPYGLFRNWDAAAPTGVALSLAAGILGAASIERRPRHAWRSVALVLAAATPVLTDLWIASVPAAGIARIQSYVHGPPERGAVDRAAAWDFLGFRLTDLGQPDAAVAAFERAADLAPSPRTLRAWAAVERLRGDPRRAEEIYRRLLERQPGNVGAWNELAELALSAGDFVEARRAARAALALDPRDEPARRMLEELDRAGR